MNIQIPKSFQIAGTTWKVIRVKQNGTRLGYCKHAQSEIEITENYDDIEVSNDVREQTLFHEITHAVLAACGERELCDNEGFVERFSVLLHQAIKTMK